MNTLNICDYNVKIIKEPNSSVSCCRNNRFSCCSNNKFRILTPITFNDGDHIVCVLKKIKNNWYLSDEGNTYMRLYNKQLSMYKQILLDNGLHIKHNEIIIPVKNSLTKAFKNFINGMIQLTKAITNEI